MHLSRQLALKGSEGSEEGGGTCRRAGLAGDKTGK